MDESGIAVTNDHVVSGAADIEVYVDGRDEPVSARLLGSSSCNDLAVIDLDGDGYPTLDWYDGDIIERIEGLPVGNDGALDDYCNVLRSHESSDAMTIQVLRLPGGERLRGSLNGSPLAPIVSIGEQVDTEVEFADTETTYDDHVLITDNTLAAGGGAGIVDRHRR